MFGTFVSKISAQIKIQFLCLTAVSSRFTDILFKVEKCAIGAVNCTTLCKVAD
jgi:hypothetical protein